MFTGFISYVYTKVYKLCGHMVYMAYTEIQRRNGRKYFYRVLSIRKGKDVLKKRKYLGADLPKSGLIVKESLADYFLFKDKIDAAKKELQEIKLKIIPLLKKRNVRRAGIFGSYARGEQKKKSDVDIIIEPPKGMGLEFVGLALDLEEKLGKKVDLVTYKNIHRLLRKKILNDEVRII